MRVGLDVLLGDVAGLRSRLGGRRVGLACDATSVTADLGQAAAHLRGHGCDLAVMPGPARDSSRSPEPFSLGGLDVLVVDVQEAGARTDGVVRWLLDLLRTAGEARLPVVLLDRPAPLDGFTVEGDLDALGGTGLPLRHGLTLGEVATYYRLVSGVDLVLEVIGCEGWRRDGWYDETGLPWVPAAPHLADLEAATLWPALRMLAAANLSVAPGLDPACRAVGAPWLNGDSLARLAALGALDSDLQGVAFEPVAFEPARGLHAGAACQGVQVRLTDRYALEIPLLGFVVIEAVIRASEGRVQWSLPAHAGDPPPIDLATGSAEARVAMESHVPPRDVLGWWQDRREEFAEQREGCLLY